MVVTGDGPGLPPAGAALPEGEAVPSPDHESLSVKDAALGPSPPPTGRTGPSLLADSCSCCGGTSGGLVAGDGLLGSLSGSSLHLELLRVLLLLVGGRRRSPSCLGLG